MYLDFYVGPHCNSQFLLSRKDYMFVDNYIGMVGFALDYTSRVMLMFFIKVKQCFDVLIWIQCNCVSVTHTSHKKAKNFIIRI